MPIRETVELLHQLVLIRTAEEVIKGGNQELLPLVESLREVCEASPSERWQMIANLLSTAADVSREQQE